MKVRSLVGLIPLFAIATLEPETLEQLPGFKGLDWFISNRPDLKKMLPVWKHRASVLEDC